MPARRTITISSEREAWQHVQRLGRALQDRDKTIHYAREAGIELDAIADTMLRQLYSGVHANPSLEYARALGGRIRQELAGTDNEKLAHAVTHQLMIGRLDKVKLSDAQDLVSSLRQHGHPRTAGQFSTFWNRLARGQR